MYTENPKTTFKRKKSFIYITRRIAVRKYPGIFKDLKKKKDEKKIMKNTH